MIQRLFRSIRLKLFLMFHTLSYTEEYLRVLYKIYLNHDKVIHFRDGYPVYSLSTPAAFSPPAAHFAARGIYRSIQNRNLPNLMSFAVNDICNVACKHCSFFEAVHERGRQVLSLEQCKKLIADAQELGVSTINFVGGEPTLREDLPEIIRNVDKRLSTTVMFTNGMFLSQQARVLRESGLDSVYVSIDASAPETHDKLRGKKGLFAEAMKSIQIALDEGFSVGISACLSPETYAKGELHAMAKLAKQVGVHELLVFDAMPTGRFRNRTDLVDNEGWVEEMIQESRIYNKDPSFPVGVLLYPYATSHASVGCSCGTSYFYVSPYGDVMSCDFNHAKFGNINTEKLYSIWGRMSSSEGFSCAKWGGCKIKSSEFRAKPTVCPGNCHS